MPARRPFSEAPLGAPLFVLNLKAYATAVGPDAVALARRLERCGREAGVAVAVAPSPADLGRVAASVDIPVLAQHVEPVELGAHTGSVPFGAARASGAVGSLVNHSERPVSPSVVGLTVRRLAEAEMTAVVCAPSAAAAARLARFRPPYMAVEPPELIGGDRAVSTARPQVVERTVRAVRQVSPFTRVLCGAGIHHRSDVRKAVALGSEGVLVASAVATARRPDRVLAELLSGF